MNTMADEDRNEISSSVSENMDRNTEEKEVHMTDRSLGCCQKKVRGEENCRRAFYKC